MGGHWSRKPELEMAVGFDSLPLRLEVLGIGRPSSLENWQSSKGGLKVRLLQLPFLLAFGESVLHWCQVSVC